MFKRSGSKDVTDEMRLFLDDLEDERVRGELLIKTIHSARDRLQELGAPLTKTVKDIEGMTERLAGLERQMTPLVKLAADLPSVESRAEKLSTNQQKLEDQIARAVEGVQRVESLFDGLSKKVDAALELKDRIGGFLEIEKPFQQLRRDAEGLRGQVDGATEQMARTREQNDRFVEAHRLTLSKIESLDRRCDDLGGTLQEKEQRVANVEQAVRGMTGIERTVEGVKREVGTLKALADSVVQKTAGLEAQRDGVDRAIAQAEQLDRVMRQIDAEVRQHEGYEKALGVLQDSVESLRTLHETVLERSVEVGQIQREIDDRTRTTRQDLTTMTSEMKRSMERFSFDSQGLEALSQRVGDLRGMVADYESRFKDVSNSSQAVGELTAQTKALAGRVQSLSGEFAQIDQDMAKMQALRREMDEASRASREVVARLGSIEELRPTLEATMHDCEQLRGAHAKVQDALEQTEVAHGEIARLREKQSETRSWLTGVEESVRELKEKVEELQKLAPTVEVAQKQAQRLSESVSAVESRQEFVDELNRRMAEVGALSGRLEDRGQQLHTRMEVAEQRLAGLSDRAEEAERLSVTVSSVSSHVNEAAKKSDEIGKRVTAIAARCESVEELAERTRSLRAELEQREKALGQTKKDLQQVSMLRTEAADSVQKLEELLKRLGAELSAADRNVTRVDELAGRLEERTASLRSVERRLGQFEERVIKWDPVEKEIARSLEQMSARQSIVEALQVDLNRMYAVAEKTANEVREITGAREGIEQSRELLTDVMGRLREVRDTASTLDDRKRQMAKAEERLARGEALLADMRSSLEVLQGQKAMVDLAVEKAGSLKTLVKHAEATIDNLREEREMTSRVKAAVGGRRREDKDEGEVEAA